MSGSLRSSLVVWPNPENRGIAVEIRLLSSARVEINVVSYLLRPVIGRHFRLPPYSDVGHDGQLSLRVA